MKIWQLFPKIAVAYLMVLAFGNVEKIYVRVYYGENLTFSIYLVGPTMLLAVWQFSQTPVRKFTFLAIIQMVNNESVAGEL